MAGHTLIDHLGHGPVSECQHGSAAGHRLDHGESERFWPVDREQQRPRAAQERALAAIIDLANVVDAWLPQQWLNLRAEIDLVHAIDLGGNLQRQPSGKGDGDGTVDALFRRYTAEKGEIPAARLERRREVSRQAVIDGADVVRVGDRCALRVRDRDQRHLGKAAIEIVEVGKILAAVQGGDGPARHLVEDGEMKLIDVKMQDVELGRHAANLVEHQHVVGDDVFHRGVQSQRLRTARHELRRGDRLAAREQGHVMALRHQFLGDVRGDPFRAAVEPGRDALHQGSNLRDLHCGLPHVDAAGRSPEHLLHYCGCTQSIGEWLGLSGACILRRPAVARRPSG